MADDPTSRTVAQLDGWWVDVQCACRTVHVPLRLAGRQGHGPRQVTDYARRLRCRTCGARPTSAELTADIQAGAPGHPSPSAPRFKLL